MLAITIRPGESVQVGNATIHGIGSKPIKVAIEAPASVPILRSDAVKRRGSYPATPSARPVRHRTTAALSSAA